MNTTNQSLLARLFIVTVSVLPFLSKFLWRYWYNYLAKKDSNDSFRFMNYGFDNGNPIDLDNNDEAYRYSIQLYEHVVEGITLKGKTLAEVGSGRGGGLEYLTRRYQPKKAIGIDLSASAVNRCNNIYQNPSLSFVEGHADNIPIQSSSVDVVINVESSHCYPDVDTFIRDVYRILKPGCNFSFCDLRTVDGVKELEHLFQKNGFVIARRQDITAQVLSALKAMTGDRLQIADSMPGFLKKAFLDFSGAEASTAFDMLQSRKLIYMSYQLRKPD